ncbi:CRISPR-associated protein, Csn2 family [Peptoniphilus duerdenii ATCC BAA-1640]|uniref:CRISPR-associated protein, Csn2 family n=1 Tax=Peptoniphilus duerdenii ATCC BAA-1640 TaxID=862517 RepID=E0NJ81_9FIRM|nr:type II-A CRISPR-associated protein Csn2 [Peptoniphilus duerdenii]EFM26200.1 CRISPR-associated protein, Csn2 family [Peptoniphilus duerdenii ATCC BAA-1640]
MNLVTKYLENSLEIKSKTINTLVVEDIRYFSIFLKGLIESTEIESDEFELIEDYKTVDMTKYVEIIFDIFNLEANSANILKKMYSELEEDLNTQEVYTKKVELESIIANITDELIYRSRFSLKAGGINYQNLFKAIEIEFDYEKNSVLERLIEYIKVTSELLKTKVYIIVNLDSFLSEEELVELEKFLLYNDIKVLALQNAIRREVIPSENLRIVDKDLCEI